jgi:hypothetical protein
MRRSLFQSSQPTTIFELNQTVIQKKKVEKLILYSSIILIGYIYVWILAIYWLRTYKDKSLRMFTLWQRNPSYQGSFPYLPEYHASLTQHPEYYSKIQTAERIKSILMFTLAIPFVGYILILVFSLVTLGAVPLFLYYALSNPTRYVKRLRRLPQFQPRTRGPTYQAPRSDIPSPVQFTSTKPTIQTNLSNQTSRTKITKSKDEIIREPITKSTPKITKITEPFFCQVCETSRPSTMTRMKCETCSRYVCFDCFTQMVNVGKPDCPMCEGRMYSQ